MDARGKTHESYRDADGVLMEWDSERHAFFPNVDEAILANHLNSYGDEEPWGEFRSPDGQVYFYNKKTGESSWTRPPGFKGGASSSSQGVAPAQASPWTMGASPEGRTYYYNSVSKESTWECPPGFGGEAAKEEAQKGTKRKASDPVATDSGTSTTDASTASKGSSTSSDLFSLPNEKNPYVYVTGLPMDISEEEFAAFMSKCGIIAEDDEGNKKVRLYRDEFGNPKGDGRVCYFKVESVTLALQILDGSEIRDGEIVSVSRAVFKVKDGVAPHDQSGAKKKKQQKKGKKGKTLSDKLLSWHEVGEQREKSKKVSGVVIFKHMFEPKEFDEDAGYLLDLKQDVITECSKVGAVKKVMIFDKHPEGVVSVKFEDEASVGPCIALMNGRWFGKRQIIAVEWDGITNFKIEETEKDREERLQKWEKYLDDDERKKAAEDRKVEEEEDKEESGKNKDA